MIKLLIVDDDQMNCDLLQNVFTRQGYHVITATSGREGLDLFRTSSPRVTLLDLRMPEMDGLTVLKEIRAINPHAPVIILGGERLKFRRIKRELYARPISSEKGCHWTSLLRL